MGKRLGDSRQLSTKQRPDPIRFSYNNGYRTSGQDKQDVFYKGLGLYRVIEILPIAELKIDEAKRRYLSLSDTITRMIIWPVPEYKIIRRYSSREVSEVSKEKNFICPLAEHRTIVLPFYFYTT